MNNNRFRSPGFVVALTGCLSVALASSGMGQINEAQKNQTKLLVSADWLAAAMKTNSNLRIIDLPLRKTDYVTGHIPGAQFIDWRSEIIDTEHQDLYQLPAKSDMEKLLSRMGVQPDSTIVLTDNMANRTAIRMYYTLKYFGHNDVRILNGGTPIWVDSKRKLTDDVPKIEPSNYKIAEIMEEFVVKLESVHQAISDDRQLIDGRPADQYTGEKPGKAFHTNRAHQRLGHVPTAINIAWQENLNADGTFKSLKELKDLYESHGIDTDAEVITYCNEGLHAAMPWFVLRELFGNPGIRVYDDSMAEWANREDTPLVEGNERK